MRRGSGPTGREGKVCQSAHFRPSWYDTIVGVGTALLYVVVMVLVAAVIFLLASLVFGRGEELEPLPPGVSPTRLPASDITGGDVEGVRFQLVFRGYKMAEVDWALKRAAAELDRLRDRIAELEAADAARPEQAVTAPSEQPSAPAGDEP